MFEDISELASLGGRVAWMCRIWELSSAQLWNVLLESLGDGDSIKWNKELIEEQVGRIAEWGKECKTEKKKFKVLMPGTYSQESCLICLRYSLDIEVFYLISLGDSSDKPSWEPLLWRGKRRQDSQKYHNLKGKKNSPSVH